MSTPSPPRSPKLSCHILSDLLKQFQPLRASPEECYRHLRDITQDVTPGYAEDLKKPLRQTMSAFNSATDGQQARDLFRAVYKEIGHPFEDEDQQRITSSRKVSSFMTVLMTSAVEIDIDINSNLLRDLIVEALRESGIPHEHGSALKRIASDLLKDFKHGFFNKDIKHATKNLFDRLGYKIQPSSTEEKAKTVRKTAIQVLKDSMEAPFVGRSANALLNFLKTCEEEFNVLGNRYYAKFISVCNSSGTGKTKTILELGERGVCLVYINLRPPSDKENFPPRDDAIASLFDHALECSEPDSFERSCIMIFRALFRRLKVEFEQLMQTRGFTGPCSAKQVIELISAWNAAYTKDVSIHNSVRSEFFRAVSLENRNLGDQATSVEECEQLLIDDYENLVDLLKWGKPEGNSTFLVIAIDEVQELAKRKNKYLPSHILGQVIKRYSASSTPQTLSVWVIFTSTNSRIAHFSAPAELHASQRVETGGELLFSPFSSLQLDIFAKSMKDLDVRSVGSYQDVIQFGRPLWKSVADWYKTPMAMSSFAALKLTFTRPNKYDNSAFLAVLSQRFSLRVLFGSREAVSYLNDSIATQMRYLLYTSDDRSMQYTSYPSEPVLSNAAAQVMYLKSDNLGFAISHLVDKIEDRVIDAGQYGELVSRLLVLISRDVTAIRAYSIPIEGTLRNPLPTHGFRKFPIHEDKEYFPFLQPVRVLDVLDTLFGDDWTKAKQRLKRKRDVDQETLDIRKPFERAYISASHWLCMTDNIGSRPKDAIADDWLKSFFLRGVAVQCCHNQPLIDKVIPILFLNEHNECDGWSSLLIQDKNKKKVEPRALNFIKPEDPSINLATSKPYIAICLHFGSDAPATATTSKPERFSTRSLPSSTESIEISACGLISKVFPVLKARTNFAYSLIRLRDIDSKLKKTVDPEEQYILATAQYGTSSHNFRWGNYIPHDEESDDQAETEDEEEDQDVEMEEGDQDKDMGKVAGDVEMD